MRNKGFMLFEMIIIIIIILLILAIVIPGLLRARISANEGSARAGLRSLASAQVCFQKANCVDQDNDGFGSPPDAAEDIFLVGCFVKAA